MNRPLCVSLFVAFTSLPFFLKYLLKKYYVSLGQKLKSREENCYFECVFIDYENFECRPHLLQMAECGENCSYFYLKRLIGFIGSAEKTINICMYMLTLKQVSEELAKASARGVKVQVITDSTMSKTDPSIKNERRETGSGIESRKQKKNDTMMHHKFCLVDEKHPQLAKLFFGSLNLTTQALCKNFEVVVFTNNRNIIQRFSEEFEELWKEFE